jgi:hypothetical protein
MNLHEFIFSTKAPQRYIRHIVFWLLWWYYSFVSINFLSQQSSAPRKLEYSFQSFPDIIHSLLILLIQAFACYAIIYFLLPRLLLKARYFLFLACTIILGFAIVQASRFVDTAVAPLLHGPGDYQASPFYTSIFAGLINAIKVIAAATAIKLVKHWWQKQKEKEKIEKERIETELQLLKSQIHPGFLFTTLNNIHSFALTASPKAPEMLLKLSDILSYMLYECNEKDVPLEKEIRLLEDYIALEKMRYGNILEVNMQVKGNASNDRIAPMLLLGFVENSFKQSTNKLTTQPWLNLDLEIKNHTLNMKLMNGKPLVMLSANDSEGQEFEQIQRRLEFLYRDSYELKLKEEAETMIIVLQINLQSAIEEPAWMSHKDIFEPVDD